MSPFESTYNYLSSIETIRILSCAVYETQPSIGPKSLYYDTHLAFSAPGGGVPRVDLRKILYVGQRVASVHSGEEILPKASTP